MRWIVKGYALPDGRSVIDAWQESVPPKAASKLDQRINFIKDRLPSQWSYDYAHKLSDEPDLWEIKFEWGNIAYRPLFCLGPWPEDLTILFFAEERGGKWKPAGAPAAARIRMDEVAKDQRKAIMYDG